MVDRKPEPADKATPGDRAELARTVINRAMGGLLIISAIVIVGAAVSAAFGKADFNAISEKVFVALLPLLGTWVGTILAFYFSRENFEAANKSMKEAVELSLDERLRRLTVRDSMRARGEIGVLEIPEGKSAKDITVAELRQKLTETITRIPVLSKGGVCVCIVHGSLIYRIIAEMSLAGEDVTTLTLEQFLTKEIARRQAIDLISYVSVDASLGDAKSAMDANRGSQDVVVTKSGRSDEPLLGWLSNVRIARLAKIR